MHEIEDLGITKSGLFVLDEKLFSYLKTFTKNDDIKKLLDQLSSINSHNPDIKKSRVRLWQHPLYLYRCVAEAVWLDRIKQRIETLQKKLPALTYVVNEQVHKPMTKGAKFDQGAGKIIDRRGQELALIDINESSKILPSMLIDCCAGKSKRLREAIKPPTPKNVFFALCACLIRSTVYLGHKFTYVVMR